MEEPKGAIVFKCKYCKATTRHIITGSTEFKGKQTTTVKCYVCNFTKLLYRNPETGKLVLDETDVPERSILLPYDKEYMQIHRTDPIEEEADKDIDKFLEDDRPRTGYDGKIKKRRWPTGDKH